MSSALFHGERVDIRTLKISKYHADAKEWCTKIMQVYEDEKSYSGVHLGAHSIWLMFDLARLIKEKYSDFMRLRARGFLYEGDYPVFDWHVRFRYE